MLKIIFIHLFLLVQIQVWSATLPEEFISRKGLPNFFGKLQHTKDSITVAYLGGSITEARNGWRDQTFAWLQKQYPKITFKQVDAAIGGTPSSLGVYRLEEHVLKYKPDLLFVEFAVNDDDRSREDVLTSMEGIVRKTWKADLKTDICFVYTFAHYLLKNYNVEGAPPTVKAMEEVAAYYGIPSINLSPKIVQLINDKKLFVSGKQPFISDSTFFSADGVHPFKETGHLYYAESIINALGLLKAMNKPGARELKTPYYSAKLKNATMASLSAEMMKGNIGTISIAGSQNDNIKRYSRYISEVYTLSDSTAVLAFDFTGESIGFLDIIGPAAGRLEVFIDDDAPKYIDRFDEYCFYSRLGFFFIDRLKNRRHNIRVRVSSARFNKLTLVKNQPPMEEVMKGKYSEYSWMVAKILVNGTVYK